MFCQNCRSQGQKYCGPGSLKSVAGHLGEAAGAHSTKQAVAFCSVCQILLPVALVPSSRTLALGRWLQICLRKIFILRCLPCATLHCAQPCCSDCVKRSHRGPLLGRYCTVPSHMSSNHASCIALRPLYSKLSMRAGQRSRKASWKKNA